MKHLTRRSACGKNAQRTYYWTIDMELKKKTIFNA